LKLYYMPAACSLSVQITLRELGTPYEPVLVKNSTLPDGTAYSSVNPRGQVPVLELDDGSRLTEGPVIVQYLVDQRPGSTLLPPAGTMARYRELEWLNYLTSEVHQRFYPLFKFATLGDEATAAFTADLEHKLAFVSARLGDQAYLMGDTFTSADGYLYAMLRWTGYLKVDLARWPNLVAFMERMAERPAVQAAMVDAGLRKAA
jgi:glutathione S-transferase